MKLTGAKAWVFIDSFDREKVIGYDGVPVLTEAGKWYLIMDKGETSDLPLEKGFPFRAPSGGVQISLQEGDRIYPLDPKRFCKTSANISAEEGTVDAGDDCDPGATILDGIRQYSGSLAGFFRFDDETGNFDDVTNEIVGRFFDIVDDDGSGRYELNPSANEKTFLLCCLNSNAAAGQTENWVFMPIIISSMGVSLGNSDVQNKDLSWTKGEGPAVVYRCPKAA